MSEALVTGPLAALPPGLALALPVAILLAALVLVLVSLRRSARLAARLEARLDMLAGAQAQSEAERSGADTAAAQALGALQERLAAIDRAQANIERLSGDVLGLQDILSNKQARGAFGEIQLHDILAAALPPDAWTWQGTLSTGVRADALVHLPEPPGTLAIDSKFPLEPYEALVAASDDGARTEAARAFRTSVRGHMRAIAEKYVRPGETGDGALMFVPSEAVYAELHARFPDLVREGFGLRVWTVSPTTCMAVLHTLRAVLRDARMREQAGAIRETLQLLMRDIAQIGARVDKLQTHFRQAEADLAGIGAAAGRAAARADRLDDMEFGEQNDNDPPPRSGVRIVRG